MKHRRHDDPDGESRQGGASKQARERALATAKAVLGEQGSQRTAGGKSRGKGSDVQRVLEGESEKTREVRRADEG